MKFKSWFADLLLRNWPTSTAPGLCGAVIKIFPRKACGKPPTQHWLFKEGPCAMTCAGHRAVDGHPFHVEQSHDVSANCGLPGTHWDKHSNSCVADDDFLSVVEEQFIAEQLGQPIRITFSEPWKV